MTSLGTNHSAEWELVLLEGYRPIDDKKTGPVTRTSIRNDQSSDCTCCTDANSETSWRFKSCRLQCEEVCLLRCKSDCVIGPTSVAWSEGCWLLLSPVASLMSAVLVRCLASSWHLPIFYQQCDSLIDSLISRQQHRYNVPLGVWASRDLQPPKGSTYKGHGVILCLDVYEIYKQCG